MFALVCKECTRSKRRLGEILAQRHRMSQTRNHRVVFRSTHTLTLKKIAIAHFLTKNAIPSIYLLHANSVIHSIRRVSSAECIEKDPVSAERYFHARSSCEWNQLLGITSRRTAYTRGLCVRFAYYAILQRKARGWFSVSAFSCISVSTQKSVTFNQSGERFRAIRVGEMGGWWWRCLLCRMCGQRCSRLSGNITLVAKSDRLKQIRTQTQAQ